MNDTLKKKLILVTGASTGIGNAVAVYLAKKGYTVLATVRKSSDADRLNALSLLNLKVLYPFDLTKPEQILSTSEYLIRQVITEQLPKLFAVVNIAGGGQIAPIELMNINEFRDELEKRLVGPIILIQKLLPLLRDTKGKVLWIATPGLFPVPFISDIHAPDFAVNYIARTLNLELLPDGITNILIRCGGINTSSPERSETKLKEMLNIWPEEITKIYRNRLLRFLADSKKFNSRRTDREKVAELIAKVLESSNRKVRYQIGLMSGMGGFLEKLPQSWVDFIMKKRERNL